MDHARMDRWGRIEGGGFHCESILRIAVSLEKQGETTIGGGVFFSSHPFPKFPLNHHGDRGDEFFFFDESLEDWSGDVIGEVGDDFPFSFRRFF